MASGSWADGASSHTPSPYAIRHEPLAISHQPSAIGHDSNRNGPLTALRNLRDRDPQLAVCQRRTRLRRVAGATQSDDAREASVVSLDQMKTRLAPRPARRLLAGNQHAVALGDHAHSRGVDARQIHRQFQPIVGFVDVDRRGAFTVEGSLGSERSTKLLKHLTQVLNELPDFRGENGAVNAGTHVEMIA